MMAPNEPESTRMRTFASICVYLWLTSLSAAAFAQMTNSQTAWKPAALRNVGIEQKMGAQVPLDLPFTDEAGRVVTLREYSTKPVILALVYFQCPSLCDMVLNSVVRTSRSLTMTAGSDFEVVAVSFDPHETPEM